MLCALSINDLTKKSTITLPINMIQKSGNEEFVYVAVQEQEKWIAKKQTINTGLIYNGKTEIIKGLKENDKIISAGYNDLTTGQQITINN
jgi:hypothetical protein